MPVVHHAGQRVAGPLVVGALGQRGVGLDFGVAKVADGRHEPLVLGEDNLNIKHKLMFAQILLFHSP